MKRYKRRPLVVYAIQWSGENLFQVVRLTGQPEEKLMGENGLEISTEIGLFEVNIGDWIVRDANGSCYPCSENVFHATYELANGD
jgi:hypothetical protein